MMKCLTINNRYTYLVDYNLIINNEFSNIFHKYAKGKEVKFKKFDLGEDEIKKNIRQISQLTLELTQNCNMRCRYCPYTGGFPFERDRTNRDMSAEIALKGIDYIYTLIKDRFKKELSISFYGGEVLLRFELLKQIVRYSKKKFDNWKLRFLITTNGTLMTSEMINFLISNNFSILISLDGPRENHDAKRVYPGNKGSFKKVWANIMKIKKADPGYFKKRISFSVVYSKELSLIDTFNFFLNNKNINSNNIRFTYVSTKNSDYNERYPIEHINFKKDLDAISKKTEKKLKTNRTLETSIEKTFSRIDFYELSAREYSPRAGACTFSSRIYLDAFGKFHICEKINNKFPIGDIRNGFDYKKMQTILKNFCLITGNNCIKCEIKLLCNPCYVNFAENGNFKIDREFCKMQKKNVLSKLKEHVLQNEIISDNGAKSPLINRKKFHQFVMLDKGPVNTAVIDLLKGDIYQVENKILEKFNDGKYDEISEFIKSAAQEEIIIEVGQKSWIPRIIGDKDNGHLLERLSRNTVIRLEIEEGVAVDPVIDKFSDFKISQLDYYGTENIGNKINGTIINYLEKDFNRCLALSKIEGNLRKVQESQYAMNRNYNSCWGRKISVTKDGKIRPCIYSTIIIGDIHDDDISNITGKAQKYWQITKDKVDRCKDCELRYACFDCREIAFREYNNLYASNPLCKYDPYKGTWNE